MSADPLIFNVEVFFEDNLLLLTPIDGAEAATEVVIHSITAPAATATITTAVAATVTATITITIAVRLGDDVDDCQAERLA
jgi:hypothetical protein